MQRKGFLERKNLWEEISLLPLPQQKRTTLPAYLRFLPVYLICSFNFSLVARTDTWLWGSRLSSHIPWAPLKIVVIGVITELGDPGRLAADANPSSVNILFPPFSAIPTPKSAITHVDDPHRTGDNEATQVGSREQGLHTSTPSFTHLLGGTLSQTLCWALWSFKDKDDTSLPSVSFKLWQWLGVTLYLNFPWCF